MSAIPSLAFSFTDKKRTYTLKKPDMVLSLEVAEERNAPKMAAGVRNDRISKRNDFAIHYDGARAEIACHRYFNVPFVHGPKMGGDDHRADLTIGILTVEVKSATHKPPILKFPDLEWFKSEAAILCFVGKADDPVVELCGCISREKFVRIYYRRDFGYGSNFCADVEQLTNVNYLWRYKPLDHDWVANYEREEKRWDDE